MLFSANLNIFLISGTSLLSPRNKRNYIIFYFIFQKTVSIKITKQLKIPIFIAVEKINQAIPKKRYLIKASYTTRQNNMEIPIILQFNIKRY